MTGREVLDRQTRRVMRVVYLGFGLCVVGLTGSAVGLFCLLALIPLGFPMAFFGIVYSHLGGIRCLWCRANMAPPHLQGGLDFDRRVQRCPYCERRLDDELVASADAESGAAAEGGGTTASRHV
jgi:hypothetical protein